MKTVKADLHIHTVLSPCGDLDMSPRNIVERAREKNLQIIGITDHNSTLQVDVVEDLAARLGICVLGGVEITTREEVHCLAFFPDRASRSQFQKYVDSYLPDVPNKAGAFGFQVVVDEFDNIIYTEEKLLITGINRSINQIEKEVHRLNGIFIPAHVDRPVNSLFSQLGFIPPDLQMEAMGITCFTTESVVRRKFSIPENITLIKNSDAHYPDDIGRGYSLFTLEECDFQEVRLALLNQQGRSVIPV
jgi:3',5'-nucleoside bisphosphate phosphatase